MGGRDAGFSEGGTGGAGMPGCHGRGRGKQVAASSLPSCWTCCAPPSTSGLLWRGTEQPLSSLFPSHLFQRLKRQRPECRASAPNPERVRGPGLPRSKGLETWPPRSARVGEARVWEFSILEELRTQDSWLVWREGD